MEVRLTQTGVFLITQNYCHVMLLCKQAFSLVLLFFQSWSFCIQRQKVCINRQFTNSTIDHLKKPSMLYRTSYIH